MTPAERNYAALILLWSRTLMRPEVAGTPPVWPEHKLDFDSWVARRAKR